MKRLFSKKSGFTLVEIIIAFAVFAIMASMLVQLLNLTINQRQANQRFEKTMQEQEKNFIAVGKVWEYDDSKTEKDTLKLDFVDKEGNTVELTDDPIKYQLRSSDNAAGAGDASGLNYFVGNIDDRYGFYYSEDNSGDDEDGDELGGAPQASRFDTRITGTKGIDSVTIDYVYNEADDEYTVTVRVTDSAVDYTIKTHSQVTLYFGEDKANGKRATIKEVNGGTKDQETLKQVKKCGVSGVNVHCSGSGFGGSSVTFKVKLNEKLDSLGFGENVTGGNSYGVYNGYVNIFGAYAKGSTDDASDET